MDPMVIQGVRIAFQRSRRRSSRISSGVFLEVGPPMASSISSQIAKCKMKNVKQNNSRTLEANVSILTFTICDIHFAMNGLGQVSAQDPAPEPECHAVKEQQHDSYLG